MYNVNKKGLVAAIYARKNKFCKERDIFNVQEKKCSEYMEGKYGNDVVIKRYIDDVDRLEMQKLISDIKSGSIQAVCAYKLDRFGRNATDILNFVRLLEQYGVNLYCLEDNLCLNFVEKNDYMTRLMMCFLSLFAGLEFEE